MFKSLFDKIKSCLLRDTPRLVDQMQAIVEKTELEITPEIEKIAQEIKTEVKKKKRKK